MKRLLWAVEPRGGVFRWAVTCDGDTERRFLFKLKAIAWAVAQCNFDWHEHGVISELQIKGRDGQIQDARSYGHDPRRTKG